VDVQSVKNTDTAGQKGYDAGKKVSGIKRHIAADTQGLPHAIAVTAAEVTDRKGALQAEPGVRAKPAVRQWLYRRAVCGRGARKPGRTCHGADCQAQ